MVHKGAQRSPGYHWRGSDPKVTNLFASNRQTAFSVAMAEAFDRVVNKVDIDHEYVSVTLPRTVYKVILSEYIMSNTPSLAATTENKSIDAAVQAETVRALDNKIIQTSDELNALHTQRDALTGESDLGNAMRQARRTNVAKTVGKVALGVLVTGLAILGGSYAYSAYKAKHA